MVREQLGTVVSTMEGPSPSCVSFVVNNGKAHKGMFAELEYSEGTMMLLVEDVIKTNRYFERPDSVKVMGEELEKNFPASEWEFLIAKTRPLGVFKDSLILRPTFPPSPGVKVFEADNERIKKFLGLEDDGLALGRLQFHDVDLKVNLSKILQKHLAVVATSGAGKCLAYDQKVQLADGSFVEIGKLVDSKLGASKITVEGVEYAVNESDLKVMALNSDNKLVPSKINVFARRKSPKELVSIKTWSGKEIKTTSEHVVPIFNGSVSWVSASDLKENDFMLLPRINIESKVQTIDLFSLCDGSGFFVDGNFVVNKKKKSIRFPKSVVVDEKFSRFFAYLLAEGHNFMKGFSFANQNGLVQADFRSCMKEVILDEPKRLRNGNEVRYYNSVLMPVFRRMGFTGSSWTKFVPLEILQSNEKVIASFLSAFIDCDGYVSDKGLEITLASKQLIDGINAMLLRIGIVPYIRHKIVKGKDYTRLMVTGAKNMSILNQKMDLLIDYKKTGLLRVSTKTYNTNIDVVPNISESVFEIMHILRATNSMVKNSQSYYSGKINPSFDSLKKLLCDFDVRRSEIEQAIFKTKELFFSIPNFSESDAQEIILEHYGELNFKQIASGTGISSTTARRIACGITSPTKKAFVLANNCLALSGQEDFGIKMAAQLSVKEIAKQLVCVCNEFEFDQSALCSSCGLNSRALYEWANNGSDSVYSNLYKIAKAVYLEAMKIEESLPKAVQKINFLESIVDSGIFFDKVVSIEKVPSNCEYVYDLSVEHSNFVANNLVVHNSYFISVLLEELLSRKKEQGQIGVVVMDTHGEYTCFGESVKQSSQSQFVDFSSKTRIVDGSKIKIACSKLNVYMISAIVELSPTQKRALSKILLKLNEEMRSGAGPFDLSAVKAEISSVDDAKTAAALHGIVGELEDLYLFGKIDEPGVVDLVKPGNLVVFDLNNVISEKKKQIIVAYISNKLFHERRSSSKKIPPFALFIEEAHNFIPEGTAAEHAVARSYLRTIAREGRKFGASLVVISQRPKRLDTTTLANCNTQIILRITNPYDLKHISESCEGLNNESMNSISSLRVGEALVAGEAVGAPTFFKVRKRKSQPSRHETTLEDSARAFTADDKVKEDEVNSFL